MRLADVRIRMLKRPEVRFGLARSLWRLRILAFPAVSAS